MAWLGIDSFYEKKKELNGFWTEWKKQGWPNRKRPEMVIFQALNENSDILMSLEILLFAMHDLVVFGWLNIPRK